MPRMTNTERFASVLKENFRDVEYDPKKNVGRAHVPGAGTIEFHEAGSDPAVIVNLVYAPRFKGTAETALKFLEDLHEAWSNSD